MISVLQQLDRPTPLEAKPQAGEEQAEFEIVMGRGQVASSMLLMLVLLVVFSAGAYVIGKSAGPRPAAQPTAAVQNPPAPAAPAPAAKVAATATPETASQPLTADLSAPLYGEQAPGKVYLQVGAVEKGLAGIWAEGLRTHGMDAFVATGPSDKMWRVVIGPLPNPEAYQRTKALLDDLGINTFGRKQQ